MQTFTDKNTKVWEFDLNLATMQDVENYDFSKVTDETVSLLLFAEEASWDVLQKPLVIAEVVWAVMENNYPAANREATRRVFFSGLNSNSLRELLKLFLQELGNFFPHLETFFSKLVLQVDQTQERSCKMLEKVLQDMKDEMPLALDEMEETFWRDYHKRMKEYQEQKQTSQPDVST